MALSHGRAPRAPRHPSSGSQDGGVGSGEMEPCLTQSVWPRLSSSASGCSACGSSSRSFRSICSGWDGGRWQLEGPAPAGPFAWALPLPHGLLFHRRDKGLGLRAQTVSGEAEPPAVEPTGPGTSHHSLQQLLPGRCSSRRTAPHLIHTPSEARGPPLAGACEALFLRLQLTAPLRDPFLGLFPWATCTHPLRTPRPPLRTRTQPAFHTDLLL